MSSTAMINNLLRMRLCQVLINEDYKAGRFKIPVHLALGHEAIALAVSETMTPADKLILTHRNMAYNLARNGGAIRPVLHEYRLEESGLAGGKLGSMNLINPERNIVYSSSILANNFPVAAGFAMAEKLKKTGGAVFVLGGDGSMEEGNFYESLVMMRSFETGLVILIENNEWSLGTHIDERRKPIDLEKLTASVGIEYVKLSGNDTGKYITALTTVRNKVIAENKPVCVEVIVKTLGDRRNPPTEDFPEGKYINYHAGPSPVVHLDLDQCLFLRDNDEDPLYVASKTTGAEVLKNMAINILEDLKKELQ